MTIKSRELITLTGHQKAVYAVTFSPDGSLLASASGDGTIKLWKSPWEECELTTLTGHRGFVFSVAFSPDGRLLASGSYDDTIRLWEIPDNRNVPQGDESLVETLTGHWGAVYSVAFSPDGSLLASASGMGTIKLWKAPGRRKDAPQESNAGTFGMKNPVAMFEGHSERVRAVAFSPDGKQLASASEDKTVKLWDISDRGAQDKPRLTTLTGHSRHVLSVAFSAGCEKGEGEETLWDGPLLASVSLDTTIRLWNTPEGHHRLTLKDNNQGINSVAFSPDGRWLAFASYQVIKLMEIPGGHVSTIPGHEGWVYSVAFSPDGKLLASASGDKMVKLWELGW